ncbi:MAG: hypothetical protein FVQ83_04760 [Chloroflexi bacterium]|nr:hypothetical protein [Chloroflexota bacterium]
MSRDLRRYAGQTNKRMLVGFIAVVVIVGGGLIYQIYGAGSAIFGLGCILVGLAPLSLIWLIMKLFEWIVKKSNEYE